LVLPIFLLLLFGIVQYGTIFLVRNQMTEAASDAARAAVAAGQAQAQTIAQNAVGTDLDNDGAGLVPVNCGNSALTCTASILATCPNAPSAYQCLQVNITYNYSQRPVIPTMPFLPAPSTITATSTVLIGPTTGVQ
jgi:Flp pilus assembly protein TadG